MKSRIALRMAVLLACFATSVVRAGSPPYFGQWSNGRGETLTIAEKTIRFGEDRPVTYRDITDAGDGSTFELQITTRGEINAFPGKTLVLVCGDDSMEMTGFASHADYTQGGEPQQVVNWYRDDDEEADED